MAAGVVRARSTVANWAGRLGNTRCAHRSMNPGVSSSGGDRAPSVDALAAGTRSARAGARFAGARRLPTQGDVAREFARGGRSATLELMRRSEIHVGDSVYLYEKDARPIGRVRAVREEELVVDLTSGEVYDLPLEVVESAAQDRVLLAAHRLNTHARDSLERARKASAAPAAPQR